MENYILNLNITSSIGSKIQIEVPGQAKNVKINVEGEINGELVLKVCSTSYENNTFPVESIDIDSLEPSMDVSREANLSNSEGDRESSIDVMSTDSISDSNSRDSLSGSEQLVSLNSRESEDSSASVNGVVPLR